MGDCRRALRRARRARQRAADLHSARRRGLSRDPQRLELGAGRTRRRRALTITPWVVRNKVEVGCFALTTDGRALWKANNEQTYGLLAHGKWIDDVKDPPDHPFPNPEEARDIYLQSGKKNHVDECANQSYYQHKAWRFVRDHPGEKAKLAAQAVRMEWDPRTTASATDSGHGAIRSLAQPLYTSFLYALALVGIFVAAPPVRRPRARRARLPDTRRNGVRRCDSLPRLDGLPACASGRRRNRLGAAAPAQGAVKVLHVHRIGGIGGSERHLLTLLPALAERGVDVRFLGLDDTSRAPDPFYEALTVPFVRVPAPRDIDPRLALRVRRETRSCRPRAHAPRACGRLRSAGSATTRLDEAQRRPVSSGSVPLRRACARAACFQGDRDHRSAGAVPGGTCRPAGRQGGGHPLRAGRPAGGVGLESRG